MTKKPGDDTLSIKVWDLPTRIFHWSLVVLALLAWITTAGRADLRTGLRGRMAALCDGDTFARDMEAAYRSL